MVRGVSICVGGWLVASRREACVRACVCVICVWAQRADGGWRQADARRGCEFCVMLVRWPSRWQMRWGRHALYTNLVPSPKLRVSEIVRDSTHGFTHVDSSSRLRLALPLDISAVSRRGVSLPFTAAASSLQALISHIGRAWRRRLNTPQPTMQVQTSNRTVDVKTEA